MPEPPHPPDRTIVARLREKFGDEVDPEVTLAEGSDRPAEPSAEDEQGSGIMSRLGERSTPSTRYRIEGEIARGGMGAILEAWDEDLRRRLAMKVALGRKGGGDQPSSSDLEPRVLARFLEEAQVTGQLDHPGIVPVHELGLDEHGQVYFTMRLVQGRDLEHVFRMVAKGEEGWSITRALGVLLKACEAMAYAHDKGVLHRDLKPANLMVGRFGEVYVMDWGLARVLGRPDRHDLRIADKRPASVLAITPREDASGGRGDELYTMDGDVVGTPAYMSPEQARGRLEDLDARSDVYSMGAMLYQLLAGSAPYVIPGAKLKASRLLVALVAGPPPSIDELGREVPAELVAICEKAMARDPAQRYASMLDLAEDLRAYLEGRVVGAYETGALAEARKWVRRNRALAASLAAGVLALAAGLAASLVLKQRADESAGLAEDRRIEAEDAAALAEERRLLADASTAEALRQARIADVVADFMNEELLGAVSPFQRGIDLTVREVLDEADARIADQFADDPRVEMRLRQTLARSYQALGDYERALHHVERGVELHRAELGERAEDTILMQGLHASVLEDLGRLDEALELFGDTLGAAREEFGDGSAAVVLLVGDMGLASKALGRLEEAYAQQLEAYEGALALYGQDDDDTLASLNNLALAAQALGRYEEAERRLNQVLEVKLRLWPREHALVLETRNNLAILYMDMGRYDESEEWMLADLEVRSRVLGEEHPDVARAKGTLAVLYMDTGRAALAEPMSSEAFHALEVSLGPEHLETLRAGNNLASCYSRLERYQESLELSERLLEDHIDALGKGNPVTLNCMNHLAILYRDIGRLEEAEALSIETYEIYAGTHGPDHPDTLLAYENLGGLYYYNEQYEESLQIVLEVLEGRERVLGPDHPDVAKTMYNLAMIKKTTGDVPGALEIFEQVLEQNRRTIGVHPTTAETLQQIGNLRADTADQAGARAAFLGAVDIRRQLGPDTEEVGYLLHEVAMTFHKRGEYEQGLPYAEDSLAVRRTVLGEDHANTLRTLLVLASILVNSGRFEQAEPVCIEYYERQRARLGPDHADTARGRTALRELYTGWGKPEEAAEWVD
jgi:serine/threonine protein kinase